MPNLALDFPLPGETVHDRTVISSTTYFDDERGEVALVLLLNQQAPYYTVAHYALTDVAGFGVVESKKGSLDVIGTFENIVPAVREYEQNGGDY